MKCPYNHDELETRFRLILAKWGLPTLDAYHASYSFPRNDAAEQGDAVISPGAEPRYVVYTGDGMSVDVWLVETSEGVVDLIADPLAEPGEYTVFKVFDLWAPAFCFDTPLDVYVVVKAAWDDADGGDVTAETKVMVSSSE